MRRGVRAGSYSVMDAVARSGNRLRCDDQCARLLSTVMSLGGRRYSTRSALDIGSPWLPVQRMTLRRAVVLSPPSARRSMPSGSSTEPSVSGDVHVLAHQRPTTATLRPFAIATSAACWTRCMFVRTSDDDPAGAQRDELAERLPDKPLRAGHPGRSAFVESPSSRSTRGGRARRARRLGLQPVDRRVVELPVACVQHAARLGLDHDRHRVGDGVRHPDELERERPEPMAPLPAPLRVSRVDAESRARRAST